MQLVLFEPEIPPNTGNIARLSAAFRLPLHLIEPLGFSLDDKYVKRAGLDYWPHVDLHVWSSFTEYLAEGRCEHRLIMSSSRRGNNLHRFEFSTMDALVFGPETRGLPAEILEHAHTCLRIPIYPQVRSINLSSAAAVFAFQALSTTGMLDQIG